MGVGTYAKFTVVSSNKMAFKPSEQLSGDMLKNDARFYSSFVFFTVVHSMHLNATRSFFLNSNPPDHNQEMSAKPHRLLRMQDCI
jgi:hypothetical protein